MRTARHAGPGPSATAAKTVAAVLGICLALGLGAPAVAEIGEGNNEIGFDFGVTDFDSNVSEESGGRFVVRGGHHFSDLFELEGHLAVSIDDEVFIETTLSTLFVNAVFNFHPKENTVPYVLAGVGRATLIFDLTFNPEIDDDSVAYQAAVGSRFFFGQRKKVAVRVEASVMTEDTFDERSTHTNFVAGFTWRLGAAP